MKPRHQRLLEQAQRHAMWGILASIGIISGMGVFGIAYLHQSAAGVAASWLFVLFCTVAALYHGHRASKSYDQSILASK